MTRAKWAKLTDDEKRIKVAELCGWTYVRVANREERIRFSLNTGYDSPPGDICGVVPGRISEKDDDWVDVVPDYLHDLNAMRDAEKLLFDVTRNSMRGDLVYLDELANTTGTSRAGVQQELVMATAAQRAESLVLTLEPE